MKEDKLARITADYLKIMSSYGNFVKTIGEIYKLVKHLNHKMNKLEEYLGVGFHADRYYKKHK